MNPKKIIKEFIVGNSNYKLENDMLETIRKGQNPKITLVTCSDSRVSGHITVKDMVNYVFHIRNIGNQIENNFGSVDYGVYHLKTPILLILGHTDCGAIKASQKDFSQESDQIRAELYPLKFHLHKLANELDHNDQTFITKLVQANVDKQVEMSIKRYGTDNLYTIGAIFDIHSHLSEYSTKIIITNINGNTNQTYLKNHPLLVELEQQYKEIHVNRL